MSRTRSPEIQKRNDAIFAAWQRGASLASLAVRYGISRQVVGRVVASYHPEEDEDNDRSLYRGYLWRLFDEVKDIADSPGWKMSPNGSPASGPDGEPAEDVMVKLEAAKLQLSVLESLRKLDARDRQQAKQIQVQFSVAQQQAMADIEQKRREMEEMARRAVPPVVQGEIEKPPDDPAVLRGVVFLVAFFEVGAYEASLLTRW